MKTIAEPTAAQQQKAIYNRGMREAGIVDLELGTKYALCLLRLHPDVDQPGDYATLATCVKAVTGIQGVDLVVDSHGTPATIPEGHKLVMVCEANLRIEPIPSEVEEE